MSLPTLLLAILIMACSGTVLEVSDNNQFEPVQDDVSDPSDVYDDVTTERDIDYSIPERDEALLSIALIPVAPLNPAPSANLCNPACGEGPQLACPKDGNCGSGNTCCYDSCRKRQVCRENSESTSTNQTRKISKREVEWDSFSFFTWDGDNSKNISNNNSTLLELPSEPESLNEVREKEIVKRNAEDYVSKMTWLFDPSESMETGNEEEKEVEEFGYPELSSLFEPNSESLDPYALDDDQINE